jgi:hypothetical protein
MRKKLIKEEINKMLLMMNYDSSKSLTEQTTLYGVCNGNNNIRNPIVEITKFINASTQEKPFVGIAFNFKIFFGSTVSATDVYNSTLNQLKEQIKSKIEADGLDPNQWDLDKLSNFRLTKVVGSASNYLNGPLQPTVDNNGNPLDVSQDPYSSLPSTGRNYDNNFSFAQGRLNDFINFLNGMSVESSVDNANITTVITDTGGCTDETRNISTYPNPGQYLEVSGRVNVIRKKPVVPGQVIDCIEGLRIMVGYFKTAENIPNIGQVKSNSKSHSCDYATFTIFFNGVEVGISNMNNGDSFFMKNKTNDIMVGTSTADNPYLEDRRGPKFKGDTVYSILSIPLDKIKEILKTSEFQDTGKIKVTIKGTDGSRENDGRGYHGDAPMVSIYTYKEESGPELIYGPKEPFEGGSPFTTGTKLITTFKPCDRV